MTSSGDAAKNDQLMEAASAALAATRYFDAERLAGKALTLARQASDFDRMARIVLPLMEARRQRLQQAMDVGYINCLNELDAETMDIESGCYLIDPPAVGADARRLRVAAMHREIPVAVLCCEPMSMVGLLPVVAIGLCGALRTKVDPPADPEVPDLAWFAQSLKELGDWGVSGLDPGMDPVRRVDGLINRLDAVPEHEGLHQALIEACHTAHRAALEKAAGKRSGRKRSGVKS